MARLSRPSQGRLIPGNWVAANGRRAATLTTELAGDDNDLVYTARASDKSGNDITISYVDPPGNNAALSVDVVGSAITVNLATDGSSAVTSTAADVIAAIEGDEDADALVSVADAPDNDGSGVVTALAATPLTGGRKFIIGAGR